MEEYSLYSTVTTFQGAEVSHSLHQANLSQLPVQCMLQTSFETDCLPKISSFPSSKEKKGETERGDRN